MNELLDQERIFQKLEGILAAAALLILAEALGAALSTRELRLAAATDPNAGSVLALLSTEVIAAGICSVLALALVFISFVLHDLPGLDGYGSKRLKVKLVLHVLSLGLGVALLVAGAGLAFLGNSGVIALLIVVAATLVVAWVLCAALDGGALE